MSINFAIRPIITSDDDRFKINYWEDKGVISLDEVIRITQSIPWDDYAKQLKELISENKVLNIGDISEPAIIMHNQENQNELYIGMFEKDYFESMFTNFTGDEMKTFEKVGINIEDVKRITELFYQHRYEAIEDVFSNRGENNSRIKNTLIERSEQLENLNNNKNLNKLFVLVAVLLLFYLLSTYFLQI